MLHRVIASSVRPRISAIPYTQFKLFDPLFHPYQHFFIHNVSEFHPFQAFSSSFPGLLRLALFPNYKIKARFHYNCSASRAKCGDRCSTQSLEEKEKVMMEGDWKIYYNLPAEEEYTGKLTFKI